MAVSVDYIEKLSKMKIEEEGEEVKKMFRLKNLIVFENDITKEQRDIAEKADLTLYTMEEVIMKGREAKKNGTATINEPTADDCYMFSYTSGTTGDPKGVKLTHKMIIGAGYAVQVRIGVTDKPMSEEDCYISYLPAAHSFEQAVSAMSIVYGMKIGFFSGNVLKLTEDM
jgi:long-chain acyl-CoA synthetase